MTKYLIPVLKDRSVYVLSIIAVLAYTVSVVCVFMFVSTTLGIMMLAASMGGALWGLVLSNIFRRIYYRIKLRRYKPVVVK